MAEADQPPQRPGSDSEFDVLVDALMRITEGDFSHRLPRTYRQDAFDLVAYFVNLLTEEFEEVLAERDRRAHETEALLQHVSDTLVGIATGDYARRAARTYRGDPVDVLAYMVNNTATEVGSLVNRLRQAQEQERLANQAKDVFLANMSHELRTPLNAILGYSELVIEEVDGIGRSDLVEDLGRIQMAGRHLLQLISNILDISKISSGQLQLHPVEFDLRNLLAEVEDAVRVQAHAKGLSLDCRYDPRLGRVRGDDLRIRQILLNLLSNAVKFTARGSVGLTAEPAQHDGATGTMFVVSDTGIGLTEEQIERIFRPFVQADSNTTRRFGGTGLGLSIVQQLCHMMNGTLSVDSEFGEGSTFHVFLPVAKDPAERLLTA